MEKAKKRRRGEAHPATAPVADANEVVDLLNSEEEREVASAKKEQTRNPTSRAGRQPVAALLPAVAEGLCSNLAMS